MKGEGGRRKVGGGRGKGDEKERRREGVKGRDGREERGK